MVKSVRTLIAFNRKFSLSLQSEVLVTGLCRKVRVGQYYAAKSYIPMRRLARLWV